MAGKPSKLTPKMSTNHFPITIYFLAIGMLSAALSGCDYVYRLLDKKGAEEKALVGNVIPFERNEKAEEIQVLLYLYGYNVGKIDGIMGLRTRNAVEKFQMDNQLEATRKVDQETWERLNIFNENQLVADLQLNVSLVQTLLKEAGFDPGKSDGKMGRKTKAAVMEFQKAHKVKVDGKVGYQTLSALSKLIPNKPQDQ